MISRNSRQTRLLPSALDSLRTLLIAFVLWKFAIVSACAATRVALVASRPGAEAENILNTALVTLGKDRDLELLERAQIARVLQEQSLSLTGAFADNQAVQAGHLLQADLFAVLEDSTIPGSTNKQPLALIVFNARSGVRYVDIEVPSTNTTSAVVDAVRAGVAKFLKTPSQLHTVCLLLVRNVDMPREYDRLCDQVGPLLERKLTALQDVTVLERSRLAQVYEERQLGAEENQLLASLQMIQLDVSREGDGWRGTIGIVGADGNQTNGITAAVPRRDSNALAEALAGIAENALRSRSNINGEANRVAEAEKFHEEMRARQQEGNYLASLRAMEAAFALNPNGTNYKLDMVYNLTDGATEYFAPGSERGYVQPVPGFVADMPTAITLGSRAADILIDACSESAAALALTNPLPRYGLVFGDGHRQVCGMLGSMVARQKLDDSERAGVADIVRKVFFLRENVLEPFWRQRATNEASFAQYSALLFQGWSAPTPGTNYEYLELQKLIDERLMFLQRWLETARRINPPDGSGLTHYFGLDRYMSLFPQEVEFLKSLETSQDPLLRLNRMLKNPKII